MNYTDLPSWQPDMPIDQDVADAMRNLAADIMNESIAAEMQVEAEADAMVPYFLIPQAY